MTQTRIAVSHVTKRYFLYRTALERLLHAGFGVKAKPVRAFEALNDVSFEVKAGECVGLVGRNGSGKSTLLYIIANTLAPTSGDVAVTGRLAALLELGSGFNPEFTGRENIFFYAAMLGLKREEIAARFEEIVEFAGIRDFIDQPVKTYSSGMTVRLAFSVTTCIEPEILIVDEALAVGDEAFQRKCIARMADLRSRGTTILFVSHNARSVIELCDRAILLDRGEKLVDGKPDEVIVAYRRMLYMEGARYEAYRQELKAHNGDPKPLLLARETENGSNGNGAPEAQGERQADAAYFDESLKPESMLMHEPAGAVISEPAICLIGSDGAPGSRVNMLKRGEDYIVRYRVRFEEDARDVGFSVSMQSMNGVMLGGGSLVLAEDTIPVVPAGSVIEARHTFSCRLLAGTYFASVGCSAVKEGARQPLHRIADALMFSVLPEKSYNGRGMVDFAFRSGHAVISGGAERDMKAGDQE
ncbi:ABC transporter ATP-binding protein [Oceanibaculum indicum]|uniref:ABC transporter ATP-binding protein n=1 Tax=Oceanibaculum indicum P24 TaxID=1207063 RepID=K2J5R1_9PROT|nr:ABC transporter ATP-binding protein [Oceanibaculum indicum]EKE70187.1 ABC transporter ATP-binding protein [Oceanibaculum indicum P24]